VKHIFASVNSQEHNTHWILCTQ